MIYCIGDSFTAGTELVDHIYCDNHPGNFKITDNNYDSINWLKTVKYNDISVEEILIEEKKRAWPNKLASLLNCNVINNSYRGQSLEGIVNQTITDCIKNNQIKTIIMQLIPMYRKEIAFRGELCPIQLSFMYEDKSLNELNKFFVENESDYTLYKRWLFDVIRIKNFCTDANIKLYFVDVYAMSNKPKIKIDDIILLEKYANINTISNMGNIAISMLFEKIKCPGGHFTEKIHDLFAKALYDYIKGQP